MNCPGDRDVLCGNVNSFYDHIGNRRFRKLIDMHVEEYLTDTSKCDMLTRSVLDALNSAGYRFLRFNKDGVFEQLQQLEVIKTVRHTLPHRLRFFTQHLELKLKTRHQLRAENRSVISYVESVTPWHQQDDWRPEWRMAQFKFGARNSQKRNDTEHVSDINNAETQDLTGDGITSRPPVPNPLAASGSSAATNNNSGNNSGLHSIGDKDVLVGRGGNSTAFKNHVGNKRFQRLIDSYTRSYNELANQNEKLGVRDKIMEILDKGGYRFLKIDDQGEFSELPRQNIREMVWSNLQLSARAASEEEVEEQREQQNTNAQLNAKKRQRRYITSINDVVVPAMKNGVLPLKGYWKFFPLPELGNKVDLGTTATGWQLRLEPISFKAESIMLEVPSVEQAAVYDGVSFVQ